MPFWIDIEKYVSILWLLAKALDRKHGDILNIVRLHWVASWGCYKYLTRVTFSQLFPGDSVLHNAFWVWWCLCIKHLEAPGEFVLKKKFFSDGSLLYFWFFPLSFLVFG